MASIGELEPQKIVSYIAGQFCGAILGAIAVWLAFLPHWEATEDTKPNSVFFRPCRPLTGRFPI